MRKPKKRKRTINQQKSSSTDKLICVGAISGARGLRGEVRLKSFTADPFDIDAYGTLFDKTTDRTFNIKVNGKTKSHLIASIDGITNRDEAEGLKGLKLYVRRDALPKTNEDEYYHNDLIGLKAELTGGKKLGTVCAVHDFGAGVILEISDDKTLMIPFTSEAVPEVDMKKGRVIIEPPELVGDDNDADNKER